MHTLREQRDGANVLIADDSPTNRMMAAEGLRRRGYSITQVDDGAQAVDAWQRKEIDLILMDIQMPVMDGLAATRRIRELEEAGGGRTPILALTAHALPEDRRRAMEAGVDEYLTKPLRIDALVAALGRHIGGSVPSEEAPASVVLDESLLLSQMGGTREVANDVVALFLEGMHEHTETLAVAITGGDSEAVQRRAHRLKGELGGIGAVTAHGLAEALDHAARIGDWDTIGPAWDELELGLKTLAAQLERFVADATRGE